MVRDSKKEKKVYKSVVKKKLNLKSGKFKKSKKKVINKKKKKKIDDINNENEEKKQHNHIDNNTNNNNNNDNKSEYKAFKSDFECAMEELTESEKQFLERQKKNESYFIKKQSQMTHRQRIEKYNNTLANLSEHHDVPKVGPG